MFTSNGKIYCQRESSSINNNGRQTGHASMAGMFVDNNRAYDEDLLERATGALRNELKRSNYDEDRFDRRLPPQSNNTNRGFDEDTSEHWPGDHLRNGGGKHMYNVDNVLDRKPGARNEGNNRSDFDDEESLIGNDHGYSVHPEFAKKQSHCSQQTYGNQLLTLRAALNEKELQLVELREQHISVVNRAADARVNWEEALKSKDRVILQLQKALHHKKSALERQEREFQENVRKAFRQGQKEESAEVEKRELKIALLETKNVQFVQELVEQQKLITKMKRQIEEKEKSCASHLHKMEMMYGRVQDLKSALQDKDEVAETKSKYCNELKALLWKRDSMIAQLQLAEQQLQSTLAKQEAAHEVLVVSRDKLQEEKVTIEKKLVELKNQFTALENVASLRHHRTEYRAPNVIQKWAKLTMLTPTMREIWKLTEIKDDFSNFQESGLKDLDDREAVLHRLQKSMRESQRSLRDKDNVLSSKIAEHQKALQENQRLTEEFQALKHEYEDLSKKNNELQSNLARMHDQVADAQTGVSTSECSTPPIEVLPYDFSQNGSLGEDLGVDDAIMDSMESEQLSNASVYHANFEKIKVARLIEGDLQIVEVETPNIETKPQQGPAPPQQPESLEHPPRTGTPSPVVATPSPPPPPPPPQPPPTSTPPEGTVVPSSEADNAFIAIQDEILKREQCWRKTEELMRAALTRRMKLLEDAKEVHKTEVNYADRVKHSEVEERMERQKKIEQDNRLERRKQIEDEDILDHRRILNQDGYKNIEPGLYRDRQKIHVKDSYLERRNYDFDTYKKQHDEDMRRRQQEQGYSLDRRKNADRLSHLAYRSQYEHHGHYEVSGHHGRSARAMQRGKNL